MVNPGSYFSQLKARELANLVWDLAEARMARGEPLHWISQPVYSIHKTYDAKRCVYASDWITLNRGDGEEAGTEAVNSGLKKPADYFDAKTIGAIPRSLPMPSRAVTRNRITPRQPRCLARKAKLRCSASIASAGL